MAIGIIDAREAGAVGDGLAEDGAALAAAFAEAGPAGVRVPPGTYRVSRDLSCARPVLFEGRLVQPRSRRLLLGPELAIGDYIAAFGDTDIALSKALGALFATPGDVRLNLGGLCLALRAPLRVDAAGATGTKTLCGGRITGAGAGLAAPALSVARLPEGACLSLEGLSITLGGGGGAVAVGCSGGAVALSDCEITDASGTAIRVAGRSRAGLVLTRCRVEGSGTGVEAAGIAADISGCTFAGVVPALSLSGRGSRVSRCRIAPGGTGLSPGIVLGRNDAACEIADCDLDGAAILWSEGARAGGGDFAGLRVTGTRFAGCDLPRHARWIEILPAGPGRSLRDVSITGNRFVCDGGRVARVEEVRLPLNPDRMRRIEMGDNTHRGVALMAASPCGLRFRMPRAERSFSFDAEGLLPFAAPPARVGPVRIEGREAPPPDVEMAPGRPVRLRFAAPVSGAIGVTLRCDQSG